MNGRERILAAIRHEVPDRIPLSLQEIELENDFARYLGIEDPTVFGHPDIGFAGDSYERLGIDGLRLEIAYQDDCGVSPDGESLNEWGACAKKDYGTTHWYPLAEGNAPTHRWPDPDRFDYAYAAKKATVKGMTHALRGPHWWPLLCRVFDLMGMEETLMRMALEPAAFEAVLDKVFEITYECTERLIKACGDGMPILCVGDDFASQTGLILGPADWRRHLRPRYARLFELGKQHGKIVWFHSCGNILEVLPDLIDIGMDVWETVQLHTLPISAEALKREYGNDITFFGGVNSQRLPFMKPEEVAEEVRRCIDALGEGGGYICSADHGIRADIPFANIEALFVTAREYRRDGYTLDA